MEAILIRENSNVCEKIDIANIDRLNGIVGGEAISSKLNTPANNTFVATNGDIFAYEESVLSRVNKKASEVCGTVVCGDAVIYSVEYDNFGEEDEKVRLVPVNIKLTEV